ncbi:hypothetical protein [Amycolatopsis sp. NPDC049868]|uniref:hypothetical protein n=1 Tax=Amycolatopsis sp. NPDC049868 TaxID=3363934 RepID=UPI0037A23DD6
MTYSGWEIFTKLNTNPATTETLDKAQVSSHKLMVIHEDISKAMGDSQTALSSFWKGKAADSGTAGLAPLIATSKLAGENMDRARQSMFDQNASFHYTRGNVRPVEKERAGDSGPEDVLSIGASDDEIAAAKFDADTKHNVEIYEPYYQSTQPRQQSLAPAYPAAHDPNVSSGPITPDPIDPGQTKVSGFSGGPGDSGRHSGPGGYTGGPSSYSAPPGAEGYQAPRPPQVPPAPRVPQMPRPLPSQQPDDRTKLSRTDDRIQARPVDYRQPGFGPGTGGPGGGNGFGPGSGGFSGGFGPGGFGPGGSAGGPGSMGPGRGVGAAMPGEGAMRGTPAGGPAAAGRPGAPGMGGGGMGGGAGKGKGGEDEEHQRKITLQEEDGDSLFGGYDGDKPVPPVIGA